MKHRRTAALSFRCFLLFALCALPIVVFGQSATATLSGTVTDPNGAVVPGVTVTATDPETRLQRITTTNDSGQFVIPLLPPSKYTLTLERQGFMTAEVRDLVLNVTDQRALTIKMKVGNVSDTVNVTAEAPLINESPAVGTVVDRTQVENMPLNGRSFQSLITLTPGIVLTPATAVSPGQFSANGQRTYSNYFTVDGVSANYGITGQATNGSGFGGGQPSLSAQGTTQGLVSVDAMQEFRIQTSSYAAEFGRSPGAQVQMLTRSGGNQFHGTAFDYVRNDKFDANDWFANSLGKTKSPERQNDFGGTLSGPVYFPRFGEGGSEWYNGHNRTFFFLSYEGLRLRQPQFAISAVPSLTTRQTAAAGFKPLMNAFPVPNLPDLLGTNGVPTGFAQFASGYSDPSTIDSTSIRIDHTFNEKITLFGRYAISNSNTRARQATDLAEVAITGQNSQTLTVGATAALRNNILDEGRFNFSRATGDAAITLDNFGGAMPPTASSLLPGFASPGTSEFGYALILSGQSANFFDGITAVNRQRQINITDNLSINQSKHTMKFGVDYRRMFPIYAPLGYLLSLNNQTTASLVAGTVSSALVSSRLTGATPVFLNLSLFGQDTWRVNRSLTVTYGLRWEFHPDPHNSSGPDPIVVTGIDNPANFALAPAGSPLFQTHHNNFAPRAGVAYQLRESKGWETIVRGGIGVFYDLGDTEATSGFTGPPYSLSKTFSNVAYPLNPTQLAPPVGSLVPPYSGANFVSYEDFNLPYTVQWNVAVEQGLGSSQTLTATYVGNFGRRNLRQQLFSKPNANFSNIVILFRSDSTSDYDAMQLQFQRRLSHGLQILSSYTWSHALDDLSVEVANNSTFSRGNSNFDVRHNLAAALSYEIPKPRGPKLAGAILGGWGVDSTVHAMSGAPVDIAAAGTLVLNGETYNRRPNLVPGSPLYISDPTVPGGRRFNAAAFTTPPTGQAGNFGRNVLRGLPLSQVDLAMRRQFSLTERLRIQLRAEAFNVLNHPNFGGLRTSIATPSTFGVPSQMAGRSLGGLSPIYQIGGPRSFQFALKLMF